MSLGLIYLLLAAALCIANFFTKNHFKTEFWACVILTNIWMAAK